MSYFAAYSVYLTIPRTRYEMISFGAEFQMTNSVGWAIGYFNIIERICWRTRWKHVEIIIRRLFRSLIQVSHRLLINTGDTRTQYQSQNAASITLKKGRQRTELSWEKCARLHFEDEEELAEDRRYVVVESRIRWSIVPSIVHKLGQSPKVGTLYPLLGYRIWSYSSPPRHPVPHPSPIWLLPDHSVLQNDCSTAGDSWKSNRSAAWGRYTVELRYILPAITI